MGRSYNEIKKLYDESRRAIMRKNKEMNGISKSLQDLEVLRRKGSDALNSEIAVARDKEAAEYKKRMLLPIEQKVQKLEARLSRLQEQYDEEKTKLTEENLMGQCTNKQEILAQVRDASSLLYEQLQKILGSRFYKELLIQLQSSRVELHVDDLPRVIRWFNRCEPQLEKMGASGNRLYDTILSMQNSASAIDSSVVSDRRVVLITAAGAVVLTFFAYRYVFPFYCCFLAALAMYNIFRSYSLYKIIIVHKAVEDNVNKIEELLHEQVMQELREQTEQVDSYYSEQICRTQEELNKTKQQILDTAVVAEGSFDFDDSGLRRKYEGKLREIEDKETNLYKVQHQLRSELDRMCKESEELKAQLDGVVGELKNQYLNFEAVGKEFLFNPKFLFDIDSVKNKPVYFDHPQGSCLVLYHNREDAVGFIRLLCVQIRAQLVPISQQLTYFDAKTMGQDCIYFVPKDLEKAASLFQVVTDESGFKGLMEKRVNEMRSRQRDLREDREIRAFNEHMLEIEGVPLPYLFDFAIDVSVGVLTSSDMQLVIRTGGIYGIFMHVFVEVDAFREFRSSMKKILDPFSEVLVLQNGNFNKRAKSFILETFADK